jgi:L-seryl-tRNA(Ser) seleniumtransferase
MADNRQLRALPSTDEVLAHPVVVKLIEIYGRGLVKNAVREAIARARQNVLDGKDTPETERIAAGVAAIAARIGEPSLKSVINATGIILHTNLGRAPLGQTGIDEITSVASGYSNLEFDLNKGRRGSRNTHVRKLLSFLTGAKNALIVNNNAAGITLALNTLARDREVIISRSELIEIGDSFRLPDIMAASGARMVEVGTTNRTSLADYESAIGPETAMLLKAHKSNFAIKGFTLEVSVRELAELAHARGLVMMYDIGSGLLRKPKTLPLETEPDVAGAVADGADLVAFSGDKLLGGPQAGILVGKTDLIATLSRAPLMRALRVGKLTIAALSAACRGYLQEDTLPKVNPIFSMLERSREDIEQLASALLDELTGLDIKAQTVESIGRCGGGTLPDLEIESIAIEILPQGEVSDNDHTFAENLYTRLLQCRPPVLAVLREGRILFDVLTLFANHIPVVARAITTALTMEADA